MPPPDREGTVAELASSFGSPWQHASFVRLVEGVRRLLRPWPRLEERFIDGLVARQNRRVHCHLRRRPPRSVLLIMPRCVKKTGCRAPVQETLEPCLACMECPLGHVAEICTDRGIQAVVAFRSHIAFALAREAAPDLIIASACRDRMIKALRSTPEIPALLAPLTGMRRMCLDAGVDLDWIAAQLDLAVPGSSTAPSPALQRTAQGS